MELPKIISVDDHVVEPPHVWQTWLPEKYREKGPRSERKRWGAFRLKKGAKYEMTEDPEGLGDRNGSRRCPDDASARFSISIRNISRDGSRGSRT